MAVLPLRCIHRGRRISGNHGELLKSNSYQRLGGPQIPDCGLVHDSHPHSSSRKHHYPWFWPKVSLDCESEVGSRCLQNSANQLRLKAAQWAIKKNLTLKERKKINRVIERNHLRLNECNVIVRGVLQPTEKTLQEYVRDCNRRYRGMIWLGLSLPSSSVDRSRAQSELARTYSDSYSSSDHV